MSAKSFFKSKTFKCIIVLLCVLLVSGVLLSLCWGFLEVTDEERFNRKIGALYGGDTVTAVEQDLTGKTTKVNNATIQKMWYINEKNDYLVQAASRGNGGDVICWVAVGVNQDKTAVVGINKVLVYDVADAAEYTSNIPDYVFDKFRDDYTEGKTFDYGSKGSDEYIDVGASYSMTAVCNDVNGAVAFVKAYISGEEIVDPTAGFEYVDLINFDKTSWTNDNGEISYNIVTKRNGEPDPFTISVKVKMINIDPTITDYKIIVNGSSTVEDGADQDYAGLMSAAIVNIIGKNLTDIKSYLADEAGALKTGATRSNELCFNAAAFALANYEKCLEANKEVTA